MRQNVLAAERLPQIGRGEWCGFVCCLFLKNQVLIHNCINISQNCLKILKFHYKVVIFMAMCVHIELYIHSSKTFEILSTFRQMGIKRR